MPKIVTAQEWATREQTILDAACQFIMEQGFAALTMDKLVARLPFAKGSVYKHFGSTEELLLAITNNGAQHLLEFMRRAKTFSGSSRERYLARALAYFLYGQLYPVHFFCELEAITPAVQEKSSADHLQEGRRLLMAFRALAAQFVEEGVEAGDLSLPKGVTAMRIGNMSWTAEFGLASYALAAHFGKPQSMKKHAEALEQELFSMVNIFMDGLKWHPLMDVFDYRQSWERIKSEVFADEVAQLAG